MRALAALATAGAIVLLAAPPAGRRLTRQVERYLKPPQQPDRPAGRIEADLGRAGLTWTAAELTVRRGLAGAAGAFAGLLLAQGDLFLTGPGRSAPGLAAAGAAGGVLALSIWMTGLRERRASLLRMELPIVADALALHTVAGESVASAVEHFAGAAQGVAASELSKALAGYQAGAAFDEALLAAGRQSAHPDGARLYELLAGAHHTGGRLADALADLAADYRAALARDLTAEGGRRALSVYGPILALMVPTALLFIVYPTLAGLRALTGGP